MIVIFIVFLTMGWKSGLVVGAALPLSAAGAVFALNFFDQGIHQMSIFGMIIAIGLLIDSAIVMTDEVRKQIHKGMPKMKAMENALRNAGVSPQEVDYINAHGTSTQMGDVAEIAAIKSLFGDHAEKLAVSSTKSMIGHLLGAAGAVEAIFSILAIRDSIAPPTINLHEPDEGCDLNLVANTAQQRNIDYALSNSFGFGGTNGTLLFKKV